MYFEYKMIIKQDKNQGEFLFNTPDFVIFS